VDYVATGKMPVPLSVQMIEVVNRQRKVSLDSKYWQSFTAKALQVVPTNNAGVTIAFVSDRSMRALNRRWRGKAGTTDVLSFPSLQDDFEIVVEPTLGDVVISVEQAARQAKANRLGLDAEISQLILHGLLHLCGFDHETDNGEMNALELRLRRRLGIEKQTLDDGR
jgi:probable rRNA maturation factor